MDHAPRNMQEVPFREPLLDEWLTRAQLAKELGFTERTLDNWAAQRTGPAFTRMGHRRLYRREAVREWLRENEVKPVRAGGRK